MEALQWFCLGVLSMMSVATMVYVHMVLRPPWYTIPLLITGVALMLAGVAWAWSSLLEGYPRSSALGFCVIALPGILLLTLTWRYLVQPRLSVETSSGD